MLNFHSASGFDERTGHQPQEKEKAPLLWCFLVVGEPEYFKVESVKVLHC